MKKAKWLWVGLVGLLAVAFWRHTQAPLQSVATHSAVTPEAAPAQLGASVELMSVKAGQPPVAPAPAPSAVAEPVPPVAGAQPPTAFADFADWAERYLRASSEERAAFALEQGIELAKARRASLAQAIRQNPKGALRLAAPWRWRQELPPEITALFEEALSGRGKLEVYCALPRPGPEFKDAVGGTIRYVTLHHKTYRAYVYGRRLRQMSRNDLPLHGIAIDKDLALSEDPLRVLDRDETRAVLAAGKGPPDAACAVCGTIPAAEEHVVLADHGGRLLSLCHRAHAAELNRTLAAAESKLAAAMLEGGGNVPPPPGVLPTVGPKTVLYMRVVFADDTETPGSEAQAAADMEAVNNFYVAASYNQTALITTFTPLLTLPQPKVYYGDAGPGAIAGHAALAAAAAGFDPSRYDLLLIRFTPVPGFDWGGLGGGGTAWLQYSGAGIAAHEIGHNYGLPHANYWDTRRDALPPNPNNYPFDVDSIVGHDSIIGAGDNVEYGDPFDIMGSGGINGHFNVIGKYNLGWLPEANAPQVTQNGTYRLYAHDTPALVAGAGTTAVSADQLNAQDIPTVVAGRAYALRVRKDEQRTYWLSARARAGGPDPSSDHGVELHWGNWQQSLGYSHLLDTTPGSAAGSQDAPILVGRTYSDAEAEVHLTPVATGGSGTETWYDVVVNVGPFPDNEPPVVKLTVTTNQVSLDTLVTFTVDASDANGDALAYHWDLGNGNVGPNASVLSTSWPSAGDYVVRCEVSDMKGGVTSKHLVIRVGTVNTFRVSGRVLDTFGNPLPYVRVHNGAVTNNDLAADYQWTYTDSDGAYTLVNLAAGSHDVGAYLPGYLTKPVNFDSPLNIVDQDAVHADYLAQPLPRVTVTALNDANGLTSEPGVFELTRTGDTNTAFRAVFLLSGTAGEGSYEAYTNVVSQTNSNPNPFGAVLTVYDFNYLEFATGVVTTNIPITPTAAPPAGEDPYVALTVMHALQAERMLMVTNTNWVNFTGWETNNYQGNPRWFQTYPDYVPTWQSDAKVFIRGEPPTHPTISVFASDASATETIGDSGLFTLTRFGQVQSPVEVRLTISGTATSGSDYTPLPSTVAFAAGQTVVNVPVVAYPDLYLEGNESVDLAVVADPAYDVGAASASVTIGDNDLPLVTIEALDGIATEADGGTGTFLVTRTGDMTQDLVVNYLLGGTAVSGSDYRSLPGTLTIRAGQPSAPITVTPRNNGRLDGDRTVEVLISDNTTYNVGTPNSATVVIYDGALPTVTITASTNATAEGGTVVNLAVVRAGDTTRELVVSLRLSGTAVPLADYAPVNDQVRIPAGTSQTTFTLTPIDDPFREASEKATFHIIPRPEYNVGSAGEVTVTINDNDSGQPAVGFALLSSSGPERVGDAELVVVVSASPAENSDVTVDYKVTGGTGIPEVDFPFVSSTGRLVFPGGGPQTRALSTNITLPIIDNEEPQPNRTIVVSLLEPALVVSNELVTNDITITNLTGEVITTNELATNILIFGTPMNAYFDTYQTHTFTILDDDASVISIEATGPEAGEEGPQAGQFTIQRSSTNGTQQVFFHLSGFAANGSDYETILSPLVIPAGEDSVVVPVFPVDDPVQEYMEDVTMTLLSAPGAQMGDSSSATVNIVDNDGTIEFTATTYSTPENIGVALIPVRRTSDTNFLATVDFSVTAGTAQGGLDFVVTNGTLTFLPGQTNQNLEVSIVDDADVESLETVNLALSNPSDGAPLGGQNTAVLTIRDDDTTVEFAEAVFRVNENATNAVLTLHRLGVGTNAFTVDLVTTNAAVTNGIAEAGVDFASTNLTVSFAAGQTEASVQVPIFDDVLLEGDETALLLLTNVTGRASLGAQATADLLVVDDECVLEFAAPIWRVDEYARTLEVSVRRVGGAVNPVSVNFRTSAGSATAARDFVTASGVLLFAGETNQLRSDGSGILDLIPGETNQTFEVRILDDTLGEGDEELTVFLTSPRSPSPAALLGSVTLGAQSETTIIIVDNETAGSVDYEFNPGLGTDGPVLCVAVQPADGKVLLGGDFTEVDGVDLYYVARLHTDGYLDSFLNPGEGTDGPVMAVTVQPDGRVLIGGAFNIVNGVTRNRIARLNTDGTLDSAFNPATGADRPVRAIAVQANGGIVVGGEFAAVNGVSRSGIARLYPNGTTDLTFDPGSGAVGGAVFAVAVQADGKLLVGGAFTSLNGSSRQYLARLNADGSLDPTFGTAVGPNGAVRSIAVRPDGRIIIGGEFALLGSTERNRIARLHSDGSLDTSFDPGAGADDVIHAVAVQADGKIVIGGAFTNYDGVALNRFARLDPVGTADAGFEIGSGANDTVRTIAIQPDTAIVIGGDFTKVSGLDRNHIARVHGDEKFVLNKVQFSDAAYRVLENGGEATIKVQRSGDLSVSASVDYLTSGGSALADSDYQRAGGTLIFAAGETEKTFSVTVLDDALPEGDETVGLVLTNLPPGFSATARLAATLTIEDDESAVAFSLANYTVSESAGNAVVSVRRSGPSDGVVSVDYTARDGTAVTDVDYTPASGTLTFDAGETERTFEVPILDDEEIELDETVQLELSNPTGDALLGSQSTAVLTIADDDRVPFYSLNITPPLGGTVTPPSGPYPSGSTQTLMATPERDYRFVGWEGTTNTALNPLELLMDRNYALTAVFRPTRYTYTFEPPFAASELEVAPWSSAGDASWQLQSAVSNGEGRFALRSGAITDGQQTIVAVTASTRAGTVSFDVRSNSEKDWDYLEFYLNGVRMHRWSGEAPWQTFQVPVAQGANRFSWRYVKDANFSSSLDAAFLDNIYLPLDVPDTGEVAALLSVSLTAANTVQIGLSGQPGYTYILQASSDLVTWQGISTNQMSTGEVVIEDTRAPDSKARFYRAITR